MKKYLYSTLAFVALLMVSCSVKEEPVVIEESSNEPAKGDLITIVGNAPENPLSKTAYDFSSGSKGEFSWVATDQIALIVKHGSGDPKVYDVNNLNRYTLSTSNGQITDGGKTAEFTNLMSYHTLEGGDWASTGFAVYPPSLAQMNDNSGYNDVFVKLPSTVSGAANSIYLVGTPNDPSNPTNYTFKTAMGVFQVTLNHIPDEAKYIRLATSDKTNYPLDGDFKLVVGGDGAVSIGIDQYLDAWKSTFAGYVQVDVSALADDATATYYFNIPVNDYPANTLSLQVVAEDGYVIETKTIKTDVSVSRGVIYPLPTLNLSREWRYLGQGKFADNVLEQKLGVATGQFANVKIFQNYANTKLYRIADPYQSIQQLKGLNAMVHNDMEFTVFSSGEEFYSPWGYTAPEDDVIRFNLAGNAGGAVNNGWSAYSTYRIYHPFWNKDQENYPWTLSRVLSYSGGSPKWVQLAYIYDMNGTLEDHSHHAGTAQIVMPGYNVPNWGSVSVTGFTADKVSVNVSLGDATSMDLIVLASAPDFTTAHPLFVHSDASIVNVVADGAAQVSVPTPVEGTTYYLVRRAYINGKACDDQYQSFVFDGAPLTLTSGMITVNSDATYNGGTPYDGGGKNALVDGNFSTYWHSAYSSQSGDDYDWATAFDSTYGICIDVALPEAVQNFHLTYYVRHNNKANRPREIKFAGSNDGSSWTYITTIKNDDMNAAAAGGRVQLPTVEAGAEYNYLRIGITESGDAPNILTNSAGGSTSLAEIKLYKDSVTPVARPGDYIDGGEINW